MHGWENRLSISPIMVEFVMDDLIDKILKTLPLELQFLRKKYVNGTIIPLQ